jgi:hypothetical protein
VRACVLDALLACLELTVRFVEEASILVVAFPTPAAEYAAPDHEPIEHDVSVLIVISAHASLRG